MSSLALMRWLEGSPERYDAGMRALTLGRVARLHSAVARSAVPKPGARVLEIGCGTGAVTQLLLERGAVVTAIDQSPAMLEQARARIGACDRVVWLEETAAEIDRLAPEAFDAVVASLCLSDMSASERRYVLHQAGRRLARGGRLVAADELRAAAGWRRVAQVLWRIPQATAGWLLVGSLSQPVPDLPGEIRDAGLRVVEEQYWLLGSLGVVVAEGAP